MIIPKKKLGRPFAGPDQKKIKKQIYLKPQEADRLGILALKAGVSESVYVERILIKSFARRIKSV